MPKAIVGQKSKCQCANNEKRDEGEKAGKQLKKHHLLVAVAWGLEALHYALTSKFPSNTVPKFKRAISFYHLWGLCLQL